MCGQGFKARTVRTGKVKLTGSDKDLRPFHDQVEVLKYDVIICPTCGYTTRQAKNIKSAISVYFIARTEQKEIYTYDEALERYRMALANAIVKKTKASKKAYLYEDGMVITQ